MSNWRKDPTGLFLQEAGDDVHVVNAAIEIAHQRTGPLRAPTVDEVVKVIREILDTISRESETAA